MLIIQTYLFFFKESIIVESNFLLHKKWIFYKMLESNKKNVNEMFLNIKDLLAKNINLKLFSYKWKLGEWNNLQIMEYSS